MIIYLSLELDENSTSIFTTFSNELLLIVVTLDGILTFSIDVNENVERLIIWGFESGK